MQHQVYRRRREKKKSSCFKIWKRICAYKIKWFSSVTLGDAFKFTFQVYNPNSI